MTKCAVNGCEREGVIEIQLSIPAALQTAGGMLILSAEQRAAASRVHLCDPCAEKIKAGADEDISIGFQVKGLADL